MKNRKIPFLIFLPILLGLVLTAFGGGITNTNAAGGTCYQTFLPMVTAAGGGAAVPGSSAPSLMGDCEPGVPNSEAYADFNGDGYADLAIGTPNESVLFGGSNLDEAGAVNVLYGTASGLSSADNQIWHRAVDSVMRDPEAFDHFGESLTVGDFDDDGYSDLAVGVPDSRSGAPLVDEAGLVHVFYGSANGLTADRDEIWGHAIFGVPDTPEAYDHFGAALASGDFNYDGYADLAVGATGEMVNGANNAGAISVIYGTSSGLDGSGSHMITQALGGVTTSAATNDYFGYAMTTGDFNSDGIDDLAVGIPDEDIPTPGGDLDDAGAIQIFYGAGYGLVDTITNSADSDFWYAESNAFVEGAMEAGDRFGHSVAAGDFNGDGYDDLGVGVPSETHGSGPDAILFAGAINVFYGSITGIDANGSWPAKLWHQDSPGMADEPEFAERFGLSLAAGDFDDDGYEDLAIGIPYEENGVGINFGAVSVMYGTSVGLVTANSDFLLEGPLLSEHNDQFGQTLSADDYDGDGYVDLTIGIPNDTPDTGLDTGSVVVRYGNDNGVPGNFGQQKWHQGSPGILGTPESGERFGDGLP